jgi:hypothetical protein
MYIMQGKPDQYITRSVRVWPSTIRISHDPCITTFRESPTDLDGSYCSRATGIPNYIPSTLAGRSVGPHPFSLPLKTGEAIGLSQDSFDNKLLVLLVSYTSMRSVRSILARGGQPISLTQAGPITLEVTVEAGDRARGRGPVGTVPRGPTEEGWLLGHCHEHGSVNNVISKLFNFF